MKLGKKKGKQQPSNITPAYMPRIIEELQAERYDPAMEILGKAALDYFGRFNQAMDTINGQDAAIVIKLLRHMADELEKTDELAARFVEAMKNITLPPITYRREK